MKDDHDTLMNDCWTGQTYGDLTWEQGLAIFREQFPMGEKPYRTVRWGKDLQIWMLEGRDFRSPNNIPDGPEKTILGAEQKKWLFETMRASDATFRILISPTPILGPDRDDKNDNLANKGFTHESDEVRAILNTLPATYVICGDRHWQYVSREKEGSVTEFSCGPGSDSHAEGFSMKNRTPEQRRLPLCGCESRGRPTTDLLSPSRREWKDRPRGNFFPPTQLNHESPHPLLSLTGDDMNNDLAKAPRYATHGR